MAHLYFKSCTSNETRGNGLKMAALFCLSLLINKYQFE